MIDVIAKPISREAFAPFGEIIEKNPHSRVEINEGRFMRYQNLATIDVQRERGFVNVSIFRCRLATALPAEFTLMERHVLGSQAFVPLGAFPFVVAVAPAGEQVDLSALRAFVTNGEQGINLFPGVWHLPLIGQQPGQEFLVIDRGGSADCDETRLSQTVRLQC